MAARKVRVVGPQGQDVCADCRVAERPFARMLGLMGRASLPAGAGVLFRPARDVHTWFMRFPIDVVFLDADGVVVDVLPSLRPWRAAVRRGSRSILELAAGECERAGVKPGDRLAVEPAAS